MIFDQADLDDQLGNDDMVYNVNWVIIVDQADNNNQVGNNEVIIDCVDNNNRVGLMMMTK